MNNISFNRFRPPAHSLPVMGQDGCLRALKSAPQDFPRARFNSDEPRTATALQAGIFGGVTPVSRCGLRRACCTCGRNREPRRSSPPSCGCGLSQSRAEAAHGSLLQSRSDRRCGSVMRVNPWLFRVAMRPVERRHEQAGSCLTDRCGVKSRERGCEGKPLGDGIACEAIRLRDALASDQQHARPSYLTVALGRNTDG